MFRKQRAGWLQFVAATAAVLLAAACSTPTPAPTATPPPAPEVRVEISAEGISAPAEMPAGLVAVTIDNSTEASTGPIFARLNDGVTQEQFMEALMTDESGMAAIALVTLLGGAQAGAGESVRAVFDLKPGNHIALGFGEGPPQLASFTVAAGSGAAGAAPAAGVTVDLIDFQFTMPEQIKAGAQTWQIENKGTQWHEMAVLKLNEGVTVQDVMAMMMSETPPKGPPPYEEMAFWAPMSAGERAWIDVDLPAGEYTVLCFLPDFASDPPSSHLEHGMVRTLTVTE
jgi:hypothetical protein